MMKLLSSVECGVKVIKDMQMKSYLVRTWMPSDSAVCAN